MAYSYKKEREGLFTELGFSVFILIRDRVLNGCKNSGAVRLHEAVWRYAGSIELRIAALDFMVERGELFEVKQADPAQEERVFYTEKLQ